MYDAISGILARIKVQEMQEKAPQLPDDIRWHLIGHLQRNKVKYIASYVHMIHAVDSPELLAEIDKQAARVNRVIPVLLQVHIAEEETKFGFDAAELRAFRRQTGLSKRTHQRTDGDGHFYRRYDTGAERISWPEVIVR